MGRAPPPPPPLLRPARGHPLAGPEGLLVEPHGVDPRGRVRGDAARRDPRLHEVPRARLARPEPVPGADALRPRPLARVLLDRPLLGLLPLDGAPLARDVRHQQRDARLRQAGLRDARHEPEQLPPGARDDGRGVAQQPPPLPGLGRPGLPLVAGRPEPLPHPPRPAPRDREGPAPRPREDRRPRPGAGRLALLVPDVREGARRVRRGAGGLGRPRRAALGPLGRASRDGARLGLAAGSPSSRPPASAPPRSSRS